MFMPLIKSSIHTLQLYPTFTGRGRSNTIPIDVYYVLSFMEDGPKTARQLLEKLGALPFGTLPIADYNITHVRNIVNRYTTSGEIKSEGKDPNLVGTLRGLTAAGKTMLAKAKKDYSK